MKTPIEARRALWRASWCLLAVAPPLGAADEPRQANAAQLVRTYLERQHQHAGDEAMRRLATKLTEGRRQQRTASVFQEAVERPIGFSAPLAAFAERAAPRLPRPWADQLPELLREWLLQHGDGRSCASSPATPPTTLEQAVKQVEQLADATAQAQRDALGRRARDQLAAAHPAMGRLLRDTFVGDMQRRQRRRLRSFAKRLESGDANAAICAATLWSGLLSPTWLQAVRGLLAGHHRADAAVILRRSTPWGEIVLGGRADGRIHVRDLLFLADLGGNDFHAIDGPADFSGHPQLVVDFAGDDHFAATVPGGYAAGLGRAAIVVDMEGNDRYFGGAQAYGYGLFGVGALFDLAGDDRYTARHHGQGAGWFGLGVLFDGGGRDVYLLQALGQGLGLPEGLGVLVDQGGDDDVYSALGGAPTNYGTPGLFDAWAQGVARGLRGIAPGGVGLLVDYGGEDEYDAGSFAQGGAYYRGVGQLLDRGPGGDAFLGSRYSLGWGAHGGVGRFHNAAGDDRYATRHVVAGGLAWDYSLALFHDAAGDDFYRLPGFSAGSAAHGSMAIFVDAGGTDLYQDTTPAQAAPGEPNLAVYFDGASAGEAAGDANGAPGERCAITGRRAVLLRGEGGRLPACADGERTDAPAPK